MRPKNVGYRDHTKLLFKDLAILEINDLIDLEILKLIYGIAYEKVPQPVQNIFVSDVSHDYQTRQRNNPQFVDSRNYPDIIRSFICKGPSLWSMLDNKIKQSPSYNSFCRSFKRTVFT